MEEDTTTNGTGRPRLPPKEAIEPQLIIEPKIVIDPQFADLLPPLTIEEYEQLKANIERDRQRDPIVVWESDDGRTLTIIEGHHRHRACQELGRETLWVTKPFDDEAHAKRWILEQHKGRRNSTVAQFKKVLAALEAADEKRKAAAARKVAGRAPEEPSPDGRVSPGERAPTVHEEIAEEQGVSRNLVDQTAVIDKYPDLVAKVESGEMTLDKAASAARMRKRNNDVDPTKGKPRKPKAKKPDKPEDIRRNCMVTIKTFRTTFKNDCKPLDKAMQGQPPDVIDPLIPELTKAATMLESYAKTIRSWLGTPIQDAG